MKILSLNLHCGLEKDYDHKLSMIADLIDREGVDLILFQECIQEIAGKVLWSWKDVEIKSGNLAWRLVEKLKHPYDWYFNWGKYGFDKFEEGMAVLSRKKLETFETRILSLATSVHNWKTRMVMTLEVEGIRFYNVHLGWWDDPEEPFRTQMDHLMQWAQEYSGPQCLIGDFNAPAGGKAYEYMLSLGLEDLYLKANPEGFHHETFFTSEHEMTFELENDNQRIDHVMGLNLDKKVMVRRVFTGRDLPRVSDHYGLLIELF